MPTKETQKTHTQHAVPQNIMDVEFKLIGDLTMRQFAYLLIFGVIAYISYISGIPGLLKFFLILGSIGAGLAFAFLPFEERGMDEWVMNFFNAVYTPNQKIWKKEATPPSTFLHESISILKQEMITLAPTSSRRKLEQYLEMKGTVEKFDPLDIPEAEYLKKVREAFAEVKPSTKVALEKPKVGIQIIEPKLEPKEEKDKVEERPQKVKEEPKKEIEKKEPEIELPKKRPVQRPLVPITPDRLPGRKFTHLGPKEGEIILPIRGERTLKDTKEIDFEEDIREKTEQLNELLSKIKTDERFATPVPQQQIQPTKPKDLSSKQGVAVGPPPKIPEVVKKEMEQPKPKEEKKDFPKEYSFLQKKIKELEEKVQQKVEEKPKGDQPKKEKDSTTPPFDTSKAVKPTYAKTQPISNTPNTISGIVKNPQEVSIEGILIIIKNHKGEAVRAIKTNSLGQFSISNSLANGKYIIDIDVNNKSGLSFDIINIEAKGDIIPPLEIAAK